MTNPFEIAVGVAVGIAALLGAVLAAMRIWERLGNGARAAVAISLSLAIGAALFFGGLVVAAYGVNTDDVGVLLVGGIMCAAAGWLFAKA